MEGPSGIAFQDGRGSTLLRTTIICSVLSGLAVIGRFASKKVKKARFCLADWMTVAGLVGAWIISGLTIHSPQILQPECAFYVEWLTVYIATAVKGNVEQGIPLSQVKRLLLVR